LTPLANHSFVVVLVIDWLRVRDSGLCVIRVKGNVWLMDVMQASAPGWEKGFFVLLAVGVLLWLLAGLAVASISKAVQYIYSEEEDPSAVKSIFVSLPHAILRLLVTSIWVLLLTLAIVITISLPFYLLSLIFGPKHDGLLATLNQVFVSVGVTLLGFLFLLSQEVAVLEPDNYGLHALKRSAKLVQEKFLAALAVFALSILVGGLLSRLSNYVAHLHDTGKLPRWTVYILAILLALLYLAYMAYVYLVTVVLYFSSKVRHDSEEGTLPSHDNPYTPLVVVSPSLLTSHFHNVR
jgi:hypothetical protein